MNSKLITSIFVVLAMALLFVGCGEVPQAEVDAAKAALDAAKAAEADKYVPDMYNAAKRTLDNAMAMVAEEQDAMFGNFDDATVQLQKAQTDAKGAAAAVPGKKEEVKGKSMHFLLRFPVLLMKQK